MTPISDPGGQR
ncbi:citrate lyase beta chain, partial [Bordetella bronchiseptica MO211]